MFKMIGKLLSRKMFKNPVFVVGDGRSGTSVLLQALGKHSKILAAKGEAPLITSIGGMVANFEFGKKASTEYYTRSINFKRAYLDDRLQQFCFEIAMGENYGQTFILKKLAKSPIDFFKKEYWAAKIFPPEIITKGLVKLYPTARFIYIIRNGIDVVHSKTKFHGFREKEFSEICSTWSKNYLKYQYLSNLNGAIKIRHEQLLEETEAVFYRICRVIGIDYDQGPSKFVQNNIIHPLDKPSQAGVAAKDIIKNRGPAYETWTDEKRKIFKEICGKVMKENGYDIPF